MAQGSPQFTADQVLEAGQQAEAGGNRDYAIQFYRHVNNHHPTSVEAASAREALTRILGYHGQPQGQQGQQPQGQPQAQPQSQPQAQPQTSSQQQAPAQSSGQQNLAQDQMRDDPVTQPTQTSGYSQREAHDGLNGFAPAKLNRPALATSYAPGMQPIQPPAGYQAPAVIPAADSDRSLPIPSQFLLPGYYDHYRTGRFLATMSGILGWMVLACGLGAAIAGSGLIPGSASYIGMVPGLVYGAAGLFGGLLMIFVSQLARAIFDNANAVRDLAAIERAKARQGHTRD